MVFDRLHKKPKPRVELKKLDDFPDQSEIEMMGHHFL